MGHLVTFAAVFKQELDVPGGGYCDQEQPLCGDSRSLEAEVAPDLTTWESRPSLLGLGATFLCFAFFLPPFNLR